MRITVYKQEFNSDVVTEHIVHDRQRRLATVDRLMKSEHGEAVKMFWVDKGHKNGAEIHVIYSNAIIKVYNAETKRYITVMIARPGQINRYYEAINKTAPQEMLNMARRHVRANLNN